LFQFLHEFTTGLFSIPWTPYDIMKPLCPMDWLKDIHIVKEFSRLVWIPFSGMPNPLRLFLIISEMP
jgi:hypothetical protein